MAKMSLSVMGLCAALATLSVPPADASAAPGDYALHSAAYAEYIANCKRAATASPNIEDEAAKKLEQLTAAQRAQQIQACQMSEAALAKREQQRQAANVSPAALVGAGVAVGAVAARALMSRGANRSRRDQYRSFENVAEDSRYVETKSGKDYGLERLRGPTACSAPRSWHRTEECKPIDHGGITCRMECR